MTKRSQWCEYDKDTRKYIKKRDNNRCILCGNSGALQIMHIFLNRSHGGRGCKENGVLGCVRCHKILDNPIGEEENNISSEYLKKCEDYLIAKENLKERFKDKKDLINYLKFDKEKYLQETSLDLQKRVIEEQKEEVRPINQEKVKRCKNCVYLVKDKRYNNSIPSYFCKYRKIRLNKTTRACNKYKEVNKYH